MNAPERARHEIAVLIVEDDPMVSLVNQRFCEQMMGFRVVGMARTAHEAKQLVAETHPDLVLLDVYMGAGSGLALLDQIRRSATPVDVIMLTAANDRGTIAHALRLGVVDYLIKPYDFDRFAEALQRYARLHALLHGGEPVAQRDLDQFRRDEDPAVHAAESPKGLDPLTLESFERHVQRMEAPRTVEEIAADLGVSRITALRYLRYLVDRGGLMVDLQYGSVGRPRRLYFRK